MNELFREIETAIDINKTRQKEPGDTIRNNGIKIILSTI